jgi:hypothetical protein
MATFDVTVQTSGCLHPYREPDDFISTYSALITCTRDPDGKRARVGRLKAYRLHAELAAEHGESLFDVCDAHSQSMHDLYRAVYHPESGTFHEAVVDQFDAFASPDCLIVDYVLLHPKWRGLRLGLLAVRKLVDLLGGGCGLVLSEILPLNADAAEFGRLPTGWIRRQESPEQRKAAAGRLRRYFRKMGFKRIAGTPFHGLSMARLMPTAEDLLRPRVGRPGRPASGM